LQLQVGPGADRPTMTKLPRAFTLLLAAVALSAGACASVEIPEPTTMDLERATHATGSATMADLVQGRQLYLGRCTGCHRPIEPSRFDPGAWRVHVLEMKDRAKLTDADVDLMTSYLAAIALRERPAARPAGVIRVSAR
jgi:mono/diheme cytochrome c family protein